MAIQRLYKDRTDGIGKDTLFAIMGRLSVRQRAILSLRYVEGMNLGQISYTLGIRYLGILSYLMIALIRLKLLLIIGRYRAITLKSLMTAFGKLTGV